MGIIEYHNILYQEGYKMMIFVKIFYGLLLKGINQKYQISV